MAKTKVSQWDSVAANNTDINSININEGCPPSTINNAIRELMAQVKDWQDGSSGDSWTSAGTLNITGSLELDGSTGTAGQVLVSNGTATPTWGDAFVTGMIMLWSGTIATIPSGWRLCNGTNGTPDLRNRFVLGAHSDAADNVYPSVAPDDTGGLADAIIPSHNHTGSVTINTKTGLDGSLTLLNRGGSSGAQSLMRARSGSVTYASSGQGNYGTGWEGESGSNSSKASFALNHNHSGSVSINNKGESVTNKNLPPYYALAYIMKD